MRLKAIVLVDRSALDLSANEHLTHTSMGIHCPPRQPAAKTCGGCHIAAVVVKHCRQRNCIWWWWSSVCWSIDFAVE
jgi:hypothetical protein